MNNPFSQRLGHIAISFVLLLFSGTACTQNRKVDAAPPESIGVARMAVDGTVTLEMFRPGHGILTYRKSDKDYKDVIQRLGGIRPGEVKPVLPWPD
jgi:hypothetical protein